MAVTAASVIAPEPLLRIISEDSPSSSSASWSVPLPAPASSGLGVSSLSSKPPLTTEETESPSGKVRGRSNGELTKSHRTSLLPVRRVAGCSSPLTRRLQAFPGRIFLTAGVFEGVVHGGVIAGVRHRELVVELGQVGHDEELVRALAANHVVDIQQLRDAQLSLGQSEGQGAVPEEEKH